MIQLPENKKLSAKVQWIIHVAETHGWVVGCRSEPGAPADGIEEYTQIVGGRNIVDRVTGRRFEFTFSCALAINADTGRVITLVDPDRRNARFVMFLEGTNQFWRGSLNNGLTNALPDPITWTGQEAVLPTN